MKTARGVDDLYRVPENTKAELVNGDLVFMGPTHRGTKRSMKFVAGAPIFAAEVRSENDYGPPAEEEMARKRGGYFAAGTLVVWGVDLLGDDVVRVHRAGSAEPTIYRRGQVTEAEPAMPGWRLPVDELFE